MVHVLQAFGDSITQIVKKKSRVFGAGTTMMETSWPLLMDDWVAQPGSIHLPLRFTPQSRQRCSDSEDLERPLVRLWASFPDLPR